MGDASTAHRTIEDPSRESPLKKVNDGRAGCEPFLARLRVAQRSLTAPTIEITDPP
jgi:hypothetical protein